MILVMQALKASMAYVYSFLDEELSAMAYSEMNTACTHKP